MLVFVGALIVGTLASSIWCAAECVRAPLGPRRRSLPAELAGTALLVGALGVGVALRFFVVPPHLAMYLDEPWYAEAACNLSRLGRLVLCHETFSGATCVPYEKAVGWPILISGWTSAMGCDNTAGIEINRVLGSITVLLVAVAARCAGAAWWQAAIPAALLGLHPVHVPWSATGETNVPAAATLLAGLCGALVFIRSGRRSGAALAASGCGLSVAIRPESLGAALAASVIVALFACTMSARRIGAAALVGTVSLAAAASALALWAMNTSISGGMFLSWGNVLTNALAVVRGGDGVVHGAVVVLACMGALAMAQVNQRPALWLFGVPAMATALLVLAYDRFHERMLLEPTVCLLPMSAFAFSWHRTAVRRRRGLPLLAFAVSGVFAAVAWVRLIAVTANAPETQRLETRIASDVARLPLGADALVIAEQPTVLAAAGMTRVMATADALADHRALMQRIASGQPTYFFRDMFCESGFLGATNPSSCDRVLDRFALSAVLEESLNSRTYGLYRVSDSPPRGVRAQ